jgi:acylpyruvate hydrolase
VPESVTELHHEIELGVVIETRCSNVSEANAMAAVGGYVLAFDMTARNLQSIAKKAGNPWSVAKVTKPIRQLATLPLLDPF